jgi:glutamate-1-semialdehyde aminotransferase
MVTLAEELVSRIRGMGWAVFAKNGTDVTTLAVSMARVRTGKRAILAARGAYHGSANWCSSNLFPILGEQEDVYEFTYGKHRGTGTPLTERDVACVILTPYHHPASAPPSFLQRIGILRWSGSVESTAPSSSWTISGPISGFTVPAPTRFSELPRT